MINLLPDVDKAEIRAGRANNILIRYVIAIAIIFLATVLEFGGSYYFINRTHQSANNAINENQTRSANLATMESDVASFRQNLATTKQILDKQVDYTKIILRVSAVIPPGVIVDQLALDSKTFNTPTTLSIKAKSETAALRLKLALNDSPYFENVYFSTITVGEKSTDYPYIATLNLTYTEELTDE